MGGWKWKVKNCCYVWSGRHPGAESKPWINQQDFRAVDLSKMRSYRYIIHVYMQPVASVGPAPGAAAAASHPPASHPGCAPGWMYRCIMYIGPHFWQVDGPEVLLIDPGPTFCTWTASRPHIATIFYPPFSTTHFYLLITRLIHANIPEWLIPNLDKTQNVILE